MRYKFSIETFGNPMFRNYSLSEPGIRYKTWVPYSDITRESYRNKLAKLSVESLFNNTYSFLLLIPKLASILKIVMSILATSVIFDKIMTKCIHSKIAFKTVLACSGAEINQFLKLKTKYCPKPLILGRLWPIVARMISSFSKFRYLSILEQDFRTFS